MVKLKEKQIGLTSIQELTDKLIKLTAEVDTGSRNDQLREVCGWDCGLREAWCSMDG